MKSTKEADMVNESAKLIDAIAWEDSGNLIPRSTLTTGYLYERLDFMTSVIEEMRKLQKAP